MQKSKKSRPSRNFYTLLGQVSNEVGHLIENSVGEVICAKKMEGKLPSWLQSWQHHGTYSSMDCRGVDYTFWTDIGKIFVQIKCSEQLARIFKRQHGEEIVVVVIHPLDSPDAVFCKVISALNERRKAIV